MAAPVTRLPQVKLPAGPASQTPEQTYWRNFRSQLRIPSPSSYSITSVTFPPFSSDHGQSSNDLFAVTTGLRVQLFSVRTRELLRTISRFDDVAHSGEIRRDGKVLVAGDDTGAIQVFDVNSRAILKTWREHKQPVWVTRFSPTSTTTLMSASDDKTVRLWDLPSQESSSTFVGHGDYVRSGAFIPGGSPNLMVTGSYDETVRVWDARSPGRAAMIFKHAAPIETVLPMPSGTTILAAADNQISVLDMVAARPLRLMRNHQKTVTSLCLASKGSRLVSGGLDGHLKVLETTNWTVVAGSKYSSPILSLAVVPAGVEQEDKHVVVGMQSGILSIRTRFSGQQKVRERARQKEMQALIDGTVEQHDQKKSKKRARGSNKRIRGHDFVGEGVEVIIDGNDRVKRKAERKWELDLRKGRYGSALDGVLASNEPSNVLTLLTALRHRSASRAALQGRDEHSLRPVLQWVGKYIQHPRYLGVTVDLAILILDLYAEHLGQSKEIHDLIKSLHGRVRLGVGQAQQAVQTMGMLSFLKSS